VTFAQMFVYIYGYACSLSITKQASPDCFWTCESILIWSFSSLSFWIVSDYSFIEVVVTCLCIQIAQRFFADSALISKDQDYVCRDKLNYRVNTNKRQYKNSKIAILTGLLSVKQKNVRKSEHTCCSTIMMRKEFFLST
jgi:hypothetical protein